LSQRWRVIDLVDHVGPIAAAPGRIVVDGTQVPLADVACILAGARTCWTGAVVAQAAKYEVPILSCDWRGVPYATTVPWSSNTRVAARHHAECGLSEPRKKNAWMQLVKAKVRGQAANLPAPHQDHLMTLASQVRSGDPGNVEARAARAYWQRLFDGGPFKRDREAAGRNASLNYGYAVLRGCLVRAIAVAGLIPTLGIFHRNRSNAFGLADDLIEPFRPVVDHVVAGLHPDAEPTDPAVKAALVAALSRPMGVEGVTVGSSMNDLASRFAIYVEGGSQRLRVPTWRPADG